MKEEQDDLTEKDKEWIKEHYRISNNHKCYEDVEAKLIEKNKENQKWKFKYGNLANKYKQLKKENIGLDNTIKLKEIFTKRQIKTLEKENNELKHMQDLLTKELKEAKK